MAQTRTCKPLAKASGKPSAAPGDGYQRRPPAGQPGWDDLRRQLRREWAQLVHSVKRCADGIFADAAINVETINRMPIQTGFTVSITRCADSEVTA